MNLQQRTTYFTTDPLITGFSAYEAMGNNPVVYVDPLGADEDGPPKYGTDSGPAYRKKGNAPEDGMIDLTVLMYYHPGSMVDCGVYGMEVSSGGSSGGGGGGPIPSESVAPKRVKKYGKNLGRNKKLSVTSANKAMNDPKFAIRYGTSREGSGMLPEVEISDKRTFWDMFRGFIFRLDNRLYMHRYEEYNDGNADSEENDNTDAKYTSEKNRKGTTYFRSDPPKQPISAERGGGGERTGLGERLNTISPSKNANIIHSIHIVTEDGVINGYRMHKGDTMILYSNPSFETNPDGDPYYEYRPKSK